MKRNKIWLLVVVLVMLGGSFIGFQVMKNNEERVLVSDVKGVKLLNEYVISSDEITLYNKMDNEYKRVGKVGKGVTLHIESDEEYYKVLDFSDSYYIKGDNLENTTRPNEEGFDKRYRSYVVFNINIETKDKTSFYDEDDNLIYQFDKGYSLPIVIKGDNKYGVEYANRLLYIHEGNEVVAKNTDEDNTSGIAVLNYHFFYDENDSEDVSKCNQNICSSKKQFQEQLNYIKENNYFTPTMEELEMYIDGTIQLPKSVVITIDDGWRADIGTKMLEENKLNGTLFLITGWHDPNAYINDYVEIHSHSDNMHNPGVCPNGQGGGIQCLGEDTVLDDLKISSEKLSGSKIFCYPFYEYNDYSVSMLKKAGYVMAFAGESRKNGNMVRVGSEKYSLPRFVIVNYTTMGDFAKFLEGSYY